MRTEEQEALAIYAAAQAWYHGIDISPREPIMDFVRAVEGSTATNIVGRRGGSSQRVYQCNICGARVDTESARYRMTRHSGKAIDEHLEYHAGDYAIMFADDFTFRRMAETLSPGRLDRIWSWRERLAWAIDYLGEEWPPPTETIVPYREPKPPRMPETPLRGKKEWFPGKPQMGISFPGSGQLFSPGTVVSTRGASAALEASGQDPEEFLKRHLSGDWGEVPAEDAESNRRAARNKGMILSAYTLGTGTKIWIITDPGHEVTTLLLPEEY